jgi:hypothetical protein
MTTRVLTANIRDTIDFDTARADLLRVLDQVLPTLGGLQEWSRSRDPILDASGYSHARGPKGGGPVLWDEQRHRLRAVRSIRLARAEFVGHLPGRRSRLGPSWCTEAILDDLPGDGPDGSQTVVLNYHLTAEVQVGSGYRRDLKHRLRVMRHKREKRRLGRRARMHLRRGRRVFALGDSNYAGMRLGGFVSCWEGHDGGTLGSRAVDIVYAERRPLGKPRTLKTHSDHRAVAVDYK